MIYDVVIIGSGPAGLSAAIYAKRAKLSTLVIEQNYISGGQIINTYEVDNYPGLMGISGFDLANKFKEHADKFEVEFVTDEVETINKMDDIFTVKTFDGEYRAKSVIIATGAKHRNLNVSGEEELKGMGVSYCATCDGAFFKDKTVVVVGGGDVAVEDAIFLSRGSKKVYLVHRRNELRAAKILQNRLFETENIEVLWNSKIERINGNDKVDSVTICNNVDNNCYDLETDGVFIAVGIIPDSELAKGLVELDSSGYIIADETCETSENGIFAAGDVRTKQLRQIITAAADGANAINSVEKYLINRK